MWLAWALACCVSEWIRRKLCRSEQTEIKLVTRSWIVGEGEYGIESIKYVLQLTASIWMPFEQSCDEESGDVDFNEAVPWDNGETCRNDRHEVWCRPRVHSEQACGEESGDADFDSWTG